MVHASRLGQFFCGQKFFWVQKFGSEFFLGKKNWVENFIVLKKIWVGNCIGLKKLGRKFGLANFYFGLIRFVCVVLLVTAKLNNNNTEFDVGGGGWVTDSLTQTHTDRCSTYKDCR